MSVTFDNADSLGVDGSVGFYSDEPTEMLDRTSTVATTCIGYESFHSWSPRPACYDLLRPIMIDSKAQSLRDAIEFGSEEDLSQLLQNEGDFDIDAQDQYGETLLHQAASLGERGMVRILLFHGANCNVRVQGTGGTPLLAAICQGHDDVAVSLLDADADPMISTESGETAFHMAARHHGPEIIGTLVDRGFNPNVRSNMGRTALDLAFDNRDADVVRVLLDMGGELGEDNSSIAFKLQLATQCYDFAMMRAILTSPVDRALLDMEAALYAAIRRSNTKGALMLLDAGCSPNAVGKGGLTALNQAISGELMGVVAELLRLGADPYRIDHVGRDAMSVAFERGGNPQAVELLLQSGVDPNESGRRGVPYFFESLSCCDDDIPLMIVCAGVDPNREYRQESPLHAALTHGREASAVALLERGADPHWYCGFRVPLIQAIRGGHTRAIDALLDRDIDVNLARDPKETHTHCHSPLFYLMRSHRHWDDPTFLRLLQRMIDGGADVNASYAGRDTVLMDAILQGVSPQAISLLLHAGARPDAVDHRGKSVLDYAISSRNEEVIRIISDALCD